MRSARGRHRAAQNGFSVVLVLVLIVMVGGMLAFAANVTSGLSADATQQIAQERVRQAALTGAEWGRYRIEAAAPVGVDTFNVPFSTGNILVTVRREQTSAALFVEGSERFHTYRITATACFPAPSGACPDAINSPHYVERQVIALVAR